MKLFKKINLFLFVIAVLMGCLAFPEFKGAVVFALEAILLFLADNKKFEEEVIVIEFLIALLEAI